MKVILVIRYQHASIYHEMNWHVKFDENHPDDGSMLLTLWATETEILNLYGRLVGSNNA
jgi:hypothetical protein